jgi:hypothetical protein
LRSGAAALARAQEIGRVLAGQLQKLVLYLSRRHNKARFSDKALA